MMIRTFYLLVVLLPRLGAPSHAFSIPERIIDYGKAIESLIKYGVNTDPNKPDSFTYLLQDLIPVTFHQGPANENGTRSEFMEYNLKDKSNDDAKHLSGEQLILRSGYKVERYDSIADDGYITILTRIINPLADRTKLRQPPVLMEHGGTIDPTAYLIASSKQHFPEKWPRTVEDGPMKSWNRSLAFTLANNGFDVWLAESRGSNDLNSRHLKTESLKSALAGKNRDKNMTDSEIANGVLKSWDFWAFTEDDIIAHEFKSHIDTVLNVTGSKKVHMFTYSLSTPTSLAFFSIRADYARKIQGYVSMAPIVSGEGVSRFTKNIVLNLCTLLPNSVGTLLLSQTILSEQSRRAILVLLSNKHVRYTIGKAFLNYGMGPSPQWQTLVDDNALGHLLRKVSYREAKQMCQHMKTNKLQKFDFGPARNLLIYKQRTPPTYNLGNITIKDWIVVSAANDELSTPLVYEHLYREANPKPIAHVVAPGFNHADLILGWGNDKYVNKPVVKYFERMSFDYPDNYSDSDEEYQDTGKSEMDYNRARSLDLKSMFPAAPESPFDRLQDVPTYTNELFKGGESTKNKSNAANPLSFLNKNNLDVTRLVEQLSQNLNKLVATVNQSGNTDTKNVNQGEAKEGNAKQDAKQEEAQGVEKQVEAKQGVNNDDDQVKFPFGAFGTNGMKQLNEMANPSKLIESFRQANPSKLMDNLNMANPSKLIDSLNLADIINKSLGQVNPEEKKKRTNQNN